MKKLIVALAFLSSTAYATTFRGYATITNTLQPSTTGQYGIYLGTGTVNNLQTTTLKFNDGTTMTSTSTFQGAGSYINNQNTLQSGATFYVSSGTVQGQLTVSSITITGNFGPTQTIETSGSGTYTVPAGVKWIHVRLVGGGGGGGASGSTGGVGGTGGNTTFGVATSTGMGGVGGSAGGTPTYGGAGGLAFTSTNTVGIALQGGTGGPPSAQNAGSEGGGSGASSPFGGRGGGGSPTNLPGLAAVTNTGSGGGGAASNGGANNGGGGGGAGGYVDAILTNLAASYTYAVGAAGSAGSAGNGSAGGAGASGLIIIEEHYVQ